MKLISIKRYREEYFAVGSAPHVNTIRRLIRKGRLPGCLVGAQYFVDLAPASNVDRLLAKAMSHVRRAP